MPTIKDETVVVCAADDKILGSDTSASGATKNFLPATIFAAGAVQPAAASGAGVELLVKAQDAASGAGGGIALQPGAHATTGADGKTSFRMVAGVAGQDQLDVWYNATAMFFNTPNSQRYRFQVGGATALTIDTDGTVYAAASMAVLGSTLYLGAANDAGIIRLADGVNAPWSSSGAANGWLQNTCGSKRVASDVTNSTTTFATITGLSIPNVIAGRKYTRQVVLKCNNSVPGEGIKVDFNGGDATMTAFWAAAFPPVGGTTVKGTVVANALSDVINYTTITGETIIVIYISFVASGAGSFIARFAEDSHASGTATVELGSFLSLDDTP